MNKDCSEVNQTLQSGYLGQGPKVVEFEGLFSNYLHSPYVLALNSCTSALHLAFEVLKAKVGVGEVLTSPLTCFATTQAILQAGFTPRWVDIYPSKLTVNIDDLMNKIGPNTKAICLVHFAGRYIDLPNVNIPIVEDCAHSFGTKHVASNSNALSCFSFQAVKTLTTGDGGLLKLNNEDDYKFAKRLRWYGMDRDAPRDQDITTIGFKYHMNDVAASIGIANWNLAHEAVKIQQRNAALYHEAINHPDVYIPSHCANSSNWLFPLLVERREDFILKLAEHRIAASPVHYRNDNNSCLKQYKERLDGMDFVEKRLVCIPNGYWIDNEAVSYIAGIINKGW